MFSFLLSASASGRPWSAAYQAVSTAWTFDLISFAIGMAIAFLLAGLVYRNRARIGQVRNRIDQKAAQMRQRLTASVASRYCESIIDTAQTLHLFGSLAPLDSIYVEQRLFAPLAPCDDNSEPFLLSPSQALRSAERLVIIGPPGSGRTTMLSHLLLLYATQMRAAGEDGPVPAYVYLPALEIQLAAAIESSAEDNRAEDPAELLVQTAVSSMSRVTARGVMGWLRREVKTGNALILLDGWDEVSASKRPAVTAWIQELLTACPGNRLMVTAGERGYGVLMEAGFVPLRLAQWTHRQLTDLSQRWSAIWPVKDNEANGSPPSIRYALHPPTPLEATIELTIQLQGQKPGTTPAERMAQVIDLLLPAPEIDDEGNAAWPLETGHRALEHLAFTALEAGRSTLERMEIQSAVADAMPPPQSAIAEDQDNGMNGEEAKLAREEQERRTLQIVDCCRALTATGAPIRAWGNECYVFAHPLLTAYLAARHLVTENLSVVDHADDPEWFDALRFYVGLAPAEPLVQSLLAAPDDLFLNRLWTAAKLLPSAPPDRAPWRTGLIKRLAQLFLNPRLPTPLRDRCLETLVDSNEAGVELLFKQAANNSDEVVRAAAILGLGALGREQNLAFIDTGLRDAEFRVRLAAIKALNILARLGSEQAMELVIAAMIEAEDYVQRVAVEGLAELGPEGYAVLREGAQDEDLIVRRAAIYGLAVTGEPWARELLEKLQREDDEWLVRNAASEALTSMDREDVGESVPFDVALPQLESEPWLIAWAAERGEGAGVGEAALLTLMRALAEGDKSTRQQAVDTLRRLGDPQTIDALRLTLRDPDPSVRQAALAALDEISRRHNITITLG